jgi:hypothetical protein
MSRFSVIASRNGESRMVGRYETFEAACGAAESMLRQGSGLGFHFKCNILCDDQEFFWVNSDAVGTGELVDLLDEWEQLTDEPGYAGADRDGKRAWVREALKSGRLAATGDAVALIPEEQ